MKLQNIGIINNFIQQNVVKRLHPPTKHSKIKCYEYVY